MPGHFKIRRGQEVLNRRRGAYLIFPKEWSDMIVFWNICLCQSLRSLRRILALLKNYIQGVHCNITPLVRLYLLHKVGWAINRSSLLSIVTANVQCLKESIITFLWLNKTKNYNSFVVLELFHKNRVGGERRLFEGRCLKYSKFWLIGRRLLEEGP